MKEEFLDPQTYHTDEAAKWFVDEFDRLRILKKAIFQIASTTAKTPDDHLMIAKQAIADYEKFGGVNNV